MNKCIKLLTPRCLECNLLFWFRRSVAARARTSQSFSSSWPFWYCKLRARYTSGLVCTQHFLCFVIAIEPWRASRKTVGFCYFGRYGLLAAYLPRSMGLSLHAWAFKLEAAPALVAKLTSLVGNCWAAICILHLDPKLHFLFWPKEKILETCQLLSQLFFSDNTDDNLSRIFLQPV